MSNKPSADSPRQARYLISFKLRTMAPLHLGSGDDRPMSATEAKIATGVEESDDENKGERPWVAAIARAAGKQPGKPGDPGPPCIPGASLKGALRARALPHEHRQDPKTFDILNRVFGRELPNAPTGEANTCPGSAEFSHATAQEHVSFSFETRTAIDRVTRTVAEGKLFHVDVVPSDAKFQAQVVLPRASEAEAAALAALLRGCNEARPLTLGAHGKAGWGRVVVAALEAQVLTDEDRLRWWSDTTGQAKGWLDFASPVKLQEMQIAVPDNLIHVPLTIQFDGPFAVRDAGYRKPNGEKHQNKPDIKPRQCDARPLLPATGFLGALRSQAERILRTLGIETPQGHEADKAPPGGAPKDLASLLFGCAGWRGLVGAADDFVGAIGTKIIEQNMIALCRVTGGVKDGAKFKMAGWESPTLTGKLTLDAARLKKQSEAAAALGLLHLTLLDLASGDISFGLGRSKGWGWVKSNVDSMDHPRRKLISQALDGDGGENTVERCVQALLSKAPAPTQTVTLSNEPQAPPIASNVKLPKLFRGPGQTGSEFHNPYHFLPFARLNAPPGGTADAPVANQAKPLGHGHDRYDAKRFSGKMTVQLTTVTPLMIGAERREAANANTPVVVDPYVYKGQRAIPGTSLRGMISSLLEPMSGSGMRVIDDEAIISVRMSAKKNEFLPHKGVIVRAKRESEHADSSSLMIKVLEINTDSQRPGNGHRLQVGKIIQIEPNAIQLLYAMGDARWRMAGKDLDLSDQAAMDRATLHVPPAQRFKRDGRPDSSAKGSVDLLPAIDRIDDLGPLDRRNSNPADLGTKARLMPGQIVYFTWNAERGTASELAWSALYRRGAWSDAQHDPGALNLRRFVGQDPKERHRLPLGWRPDKTLHNAEWLLGVVQGKVETGEVAASFASKLAFGMARSAQSAKTLPAITLKELSSPKPPSPALYIRRKNGNAAPISKDQLVSKPEDFRFQGTKTYLHAQRINGVVVGLGEDGDPGNTMPWVSMRPAVAPPGPANKTYHLSNRQVSVQPIAGGQLFNFEIRFDNLSVDELNLLCAALYPSANYEHKLGMGRPIGLGSVKLQVTSLQLEDRVKRYRSGAITSQQPDADPGQLAEQGMAHLRRRDPALHHALLTLGEPKHVTAPVHYPQIAAGRIEDLNFQWWMQNDGLGAGAQSLAPVKAEQPPPRK
jgi:CRISPR/Cas system CSM-associated protein Csm3 (group 7 of RAMP superfamily)